MLPLSWQALLQAVKRTSKRLSAKEGMNATSILLIQICYSATVFADTSFSNKYTTSNVFPVWNFKLKKTVLISFPCVCLCTSLARHSNPDTHTLQESYS